MKYSFYQLVFIIVLCFGQNIAAKNWKTIARKDLKEAYKIVAENHPGVVNDDDHGFVDRMTVRYKNAVRKVCTIKNEAGYRALISWFLNGFQDKHVKIIFKNSSKSIWWPGFLVALKQQEFRVSYVDSDWSVPLPPRSARLLAVDGLSPELFVDANVLAYNNGIAGLEADYVRLAPQLFIDDGNPWYKRPCCAIFEVDGKNKSFDLCWQSISLPDFESKRDSVTPKIVRNYSLDELIDGGVWISLPSFWPATAEVPLLKSIIERVAVMRDHKYFVLDLRSNSGGTSTWGFELLGALYGQAYRYGNPNQVGSNNDVYQDWRVSPGNYERVQWLVQRDIEQLGKPSDYMASVQKLMEDALKKGIHFVHPETPVVSESSQPDEPLFKGKLFLLTDYSCFSACLSFLDAALTLPNAVQVGLPTSADTVYEPIKPVVLPSGNELLIPICIQRNRRRPNNVAYVPAVSYRFNGDIFNTESLKQWIAQLTICK